MRVASRSNSVRVRWMVSPLRRDVRDVQVDAERSDLEAWSSRPEPTCRWRRSSELTRADDDLRRERLGDVVVAARGEADQLVDLVGARRSGR